MSSVNNICWVVTCYNELEYAEQCISSIRRNDEGPIIIINDGGAQNNELKDLANRENATYIKSTNMKNPEAGLLWWHRFFEAGLSANTDYIVKLDPDSYFHRPLEIPIGDLHFFGTIVDRKSVVVDTETGAVTGSRNPYSVQGGVQGFSRAHAQSIMRSGLLPTPDSIPGQRYVEVKAGDHTMYFNKERRRRFVVPLMNYEEDVLKQINHSLRDDGSFSTDRSIMFINRRLRQLGQSWNEVYSVWGLFDNGQSVDKINEDTPYAITHPHGVGENFMVSSEHKNRVNICKQCKYYNVVKGHCRANDTYIYKETKLQSARCPIRRW